MISFEEAYNTVLETAYDFGKVLVPLEKTDGRILAETVLADRDFPPFDRATKDGIAIWVDGGDIPETFEIQGTAAAGSEQKRLTSSKNCLEIMTGAVVPIKANTVVMYEHIEINEGIARILKPITKGQNVHFRGSDEPKGTVLLEMGTRISPAEIGVLATVGKTEVSVKRNPRITLFSTGDELVSVHQTPKAHQIRQSNSHTLRAALFEDGIASEMVHVQDEKASIKATLLKALNTSDALLLSGGVSKGKYDYLPEVLDEVGVKKYFHRVMQRPGKPFWFGHHEQSNTTIFGFPGNPTSTFANFHVYFKPWLNVCMGQAIQKNQVILNDSFENITDLTRFVRARVDLLDGQMLASLVQGNGSGDLTSLTIANGFVQFKPNQKLTEGEKVPFISTRRIL